VRTVITPAAPTKQTTTIAAATAAAATAAVRLDGDTNRIKREMDVRAFNSPKSPVGVYLISTRAGGQGINLATADTVVLYDTCWNPQVAGLSGCSSSSTFATIDNQILTSFLFLLYFH
jgi:hypothetical protein